MPDLDHKLYRLIISRLDGDRAGAASYQDELIRLVQNGISGFIVFGGKKDDVKSCISTLQSIPETPLFIASDIERGVGQQIEGATTFPGQMAVAAAVDRHDFDRVKVLADALTAIASECIDIGINMPLMPVLDVNSNPDNPIICTRAFSDDPDVVSWFGKMYIRTIEKYGLISCAKHFPGHGDTAIDSHISLPVISKTFRELNDTDLFPFIEAVRTGVSSIMIGHISVPAIDDLPASLSKKTVTEILRVELDYKGLVLTDALNMHALNEYENAAVKCLNAGVDIILHPADPVETVNDLRLSLSRGELKEKIVDAAVERIMKYRAGIRNIRPPGKQPTCMLCKGDDYPAHKALAEEISDSSITLLKQRPGLLPVRDLHDVTLIFIGDENRHEVSFGTDGYTTLEKCSGNALKETVIFILFTSIAAWQGSSGISDEDMNAIKKLIKKSRKSIVISFGSPYVLRHFTEADGLIAAYDTGRPAQASVMKCLKGERDFKGKLPVKL